MGRTSIAPTDRFRGLVVVPDVATNFLREVSDGREDPPSDEIAFDLRKPELDLVEPGRIGRREMQLHVWMLQQKRPHGLGLMRRQIVGDDVNLAPLRLRRDDLADCVSRAASNESVPWR